MAPQRHDARRCAGAGFRASDAFAAQLHRNLQCQSDVSEVLNRAVAHGFLM